MSAPTGKTDTAALRPTLEAMKLPDLKQLAAGLSIAPTGPPGHKKSWQEPLEHYLQDHEAKLALDPLYQHLYVTGAGTKPKPRTTSEDKAKQDAAAAKQGQEPTPCVSRSSLGHLAHRLYHFSRAFKALLARDLPVDPPGLVLPKSSKTATFDVLAQAPVGGGVSQSLYLHLLQPITCHRSKQASCFFRSSRLERSSRNRVSA